MFAGFAQQWEIPSTRGRDSCLYKPNLHLHRAAFCRQLSTVQRIRLSTQLFAHTQWPATKGQGSDSDSASCSKNSSSLLSTIDSTMSTASHTIIHSY